MAKRFKQYANNIGIIVKNALVETYHSMGIVEYYHRSLQYVYSIITTKILIIKPNLAFQRFFKAINNLVSVSGLVFTLFVFGVYFRMTELDAQSLSIIQQIIAMKKVKKRV